ncbi:salicylate hydroxylase [Lentinula edodes]|uniref:Salicylate hydroxylase n=1 Tax=Lentinula edodes TaxID=5353 RepID=A0A1Q3ESA1_LENED|nr:salicylate hydroxylase [Lentinula edodes]
MGRILKRLGCWKPVTKEATEVKVASIRQHNDNKELGRVEFAHVRDEYGTPHMVSHRSSLAGELYNACKEEKAITFHFDSSCSIKTWQPKPKLVVTPRNGESYDVFADVVLAADGIKSSVRPQILKELGVDVEVTDSEADQVTRWIGERRHIIAYPISNKNIYNISTAQPDTHFASAPSATYTTRGSKVDMLDSFKDFCPLIHRMLNLVPEGDVCEWKLRVHSPLPTWVRGSVALVGDACHPTLPHLAQGAAQAVEDAGVLAVILSMLPEASSDSINKALRVIYANATVSFNPLFNAMTGRRPLPLIFLSICILLCELSFVSSTAVNRSIDDTLGDSVTGNRPTYLPDTTGVWEDNTCSGCALEPDISSAFDDTYTAATYNPELKNISISFDFIGTAVYIFFILANDPDPGISASTAANFTLDGTLVSTFTHSPNSSASAPSFYFNETVIIISILTMRCIQTGYHNVVVVFFIVVILRRIKYLRLFIHAVRFQNRIFAWFFCQRRKKSEDIGYHNDDPNTVLQREIDPFILPPASDFTQPDDSSRPSSTFRTSTALLKRTATGISEGVPRTSSTIPPPLPLDSKSAIRRQRKQDLERQMQQISSEIRDLQIEAAERNGGRDPTMSSLISAPSRALSSVTRSRSVRSPRSPDGKEDVSQLKAQIQAMSEHIAYLQDQQNSAWAQGLSDEPPPGYSPGPVDGHAVISSI